MRYLLDANVFIQAYNNYYGLDFCPAFWDWILHKCNEGVMGSIWPVYGELIKKEDEISEWAKNLRIHIFKKDYENSVIHYRDIVRWAASSNYKQVGINDFLSGADPWLVAYAKTNDCILVTQEKFNPDIKRRIPLPNCCMQFEVEYINTFDLLRREKARFVLGTS